MGTKIQHCLHPECRLTSRTRGVCHGHYQTMRSYVRKAVKAGTCTEAEYESDLMSRGLLLPKGTGGNPVSGHDVFQFGSTARGRGAKS